MECGGEVDMVVFDPGCCDERYEWRVGYLTPNRDIVRMRSIMPAHRNQGRGRKGSVVGEADVVVLVPGMLK